jgi:DNA polymerase-3 subunit alpha
MNKNYTVFHLHTMLSNPTTTMDSVNSYTHYIDRAKELNMNAICFSEHGNLYEWLHKKEYAEQNGLKYIHGVEAYITKSLDEKVRDNYHCILIARNYEGFKELNYLMCGKKAFNRDDGHFYYQPRITFEELINTSDNIIVTTACLGSILNSGDEILKNRFIEFLSNNKKRCFLEIQHHNVQDQIKYNKYLYNLSLKYNIPLIAGTDTHALNDIYADGRIILQRSKNTYFENEDGWDLTFKSYDELVKCYEMQNSLHKKIYLMAIKNTNLLTDMIEPFDIDRSNKYPQLYENSLEVFKNKIREYVKDRNISIDDIKKNRIIHELNTYIKSDAINYMLLEEDIKRWCRENGINYGYSRGSVSGSYIAYLLKITDIDSIKHDMKFERFMNPERISNPDIDTDYPPSQRDLVKEYIFNKEGLYCSDIITFNTIADKGAIRDVGRALNIPLSTIDDISKRFEDNENSLRKEYPKLFKYVDLLKGVVTSVSYHPCGVIVSPFSIEETVGTFTTTTNIYPITQLNMKEIDSMNFVKLDILGLDNIEIINETCKLAGIERLTPDNIDEEDEKVWESIHDSGLGIFQWSSNMAHSYYKQLFSRETLEIIKAQNPNFKYMNLFSIGNSAIRPAGDSYRDDLAKGIFKDNGHDALNELLAKTNGFLVYQETLLEFLNKFCGYSLGKADVIRRGFAKKLGTEQYIQDIKDGFIKTMKDKYNISTSESEDIIESFLKVIIDASSYLFSENHSLPYSYIGYICAWLRYYYPLEFLTVMLDINKDKLDKTSEIIEYINKYTNIQLMPITYGKSRSKYTFDKSENKIYKSITSIKYCNSAIAEELYQLSKDTNHDNFIDLLADIKEKTSTDARQLNILITLNFFSKYGKNKKLLQIADIYDKLATRKQINFKQIEELGINEDMLKKYSTKTTKTLYKDLDMIGYIKESIQSIEDKTLSAKEQIQFEIENLGYPIYIHEDARDSFYFVVEYKTYNDKTKPYVKLRQVNNGYEFKTKVKDGKYFAKNPFKLYSILDVITFKEQFKTKNVGGEWRKTDEKEQILTEWKVY